MFKIATWNVNSVNSRIEHLLDFIAKHDPDVICLQELKCLEEQFPKERLSGLPYNLYIHGQKAYNGVATLSKKPIDEQKTSFPGNPLPDEARFIEGCFDSEIGYVRVISLYAPNGGAAYGDKYHVKLEFYDRFIEYIESINSLDEKLFICSDFNIAPFDIDVHDPIELENSTCFTLLEKRKLRTLLNGNFEDCYRALHPLKQEFSWWDYRAGSFPRNKGMRIDSVIASSNALSSIKDAFIDKDMRSKEKPSDHAPVIVQFNSL